MNPNLEDIISSEVKETFKNFSFNENIKEDLDFIESDSRKTLEEQIDITEIPAPTFLEKNRAKYFMNKLKELGLNKVIMDKVGNVYGVKPGIGKGPKVFVSAHLDTVFPEDTDVTVKRKGEVFSAPGINDDSRGLAELLSIIRTLNQSKLSNQGDIIFGATVGEEGAGDLRGVKHIFKEHKDIDGFLSIDVPNFNEIVYKGTGSARYKILYKGLGGHSFGDFGIPSATHALGRAIAKISELQTVEEPKTTFTVGEIFGGTSVNSIADKAGMTVDLRSNRAQELKQLVDKFMKIVKQAAYEENKRWRSDTLTFDIEQFGDRPPAQQSFNDTIVQTAYSAIKLAGGDPKLSMPVSTDANYPMSLNIPSVTLGIGGEFGGIHSLHEWYNPKDSYLGVQKSFLTIIGLTGVEGVSNPLL